MAVTFLAVFFFFVLVLRLFIVVRWTVICITKRYSVNMNLFHNSRLPIFTATSEHPKLLGVNNLFRNTFDEH